MSLSTTMQQRYKVATFPELAERVAFTIGSTPDDRQLYHELIRRQRFIPAGNTLLAGAPGEEKGIRPNCCILPPIHEGNFDELAERSALLWADRIGIGFDFSEAHDPVALLRKLSKINASIKLDHRPQRGNMAVLSCKHPRIREFIHCKDTSDDVLKTGQDKSDLYNFNISVGWDSDCADVDLMVTISKSAWKSGDPGIIWMDLVQGVSDNEGTPNKIHPQKLGKLKASVPCGEQLLFSNETCCLGSMNLACPDFWLTGPNGQIHFQAELFQDSVRLAVRFLDDCIDRADIRDPLLKAQSLNTRRVGLGVMGWADAILLNSKDPTRTDPMFYGSPASYALAHLVGSKFKQAAHQASRELGIERGFCPALMNDPSVYDPTKPLTASNQAILRRNLAITCIAPTGGITLLTPNKGFAIEPFFSESNQLEPEQHIEMQKIWESYVDNNVSKTVNMSNDSTPNRILRTFDYAQQQRLKSMTIYRDGSKMYQPMEVSGVDTKIESAVENLQCRSGTCNL